MASANDTASGLLRAAALAGLLAVIAGNGDVRCTPAPVECSGEPSCDCREDLPSLVITEILPRSVADGGCVEWFEVYNPGEEGRALRGGRRLRPDRHAMRRCRVLASDGAMHAAALLTPRRVRVQTRIEAPLALSLRARRRPGGRCGCAPRVASLGPEPSLPVAAGRLGARDRVVSVAGYPLEDVSPRDAAALLAGPPDSEVAVEVSGSGGDAVRALRLRRR